MKCQQTESLTIIVRNVVDIALTGAWVEKNVVKRSPLSPQHRRWRPVSSGICSPVFSCKRYFKPSKQTWRHTITDTVTWLQVQTTIKASVLSFDRYFLIFLFKTELRRLHSSVVWRHENTNVVCVSEEQPWPIFILKLFELNNTYLWRKFNWDCDLSY